MWGLAIIHLRRAVSLKQGNGANHAGLITAYMKIKRYDLAEKALKDTERLSLLSSELDDLRQQLAGVLGRNSL